MSLRFRFLDLALNNMGPNKDPSPSPTAAVDALTPVGVGNSVERIRGAPGKPGVLIT